jgi:hypothetical protein
MEPGIALPAQTHSSTRRFDFLALSWHGLGILPLKDRHDIDVRKTVSERSNPEVELHTHLSTGQRPLSKVLGGRVQEFCDFWGAPAWQLRYTLRVQKFRKFR